ncbi:MAG: hypothetical protein IJQ02_11790 [Oscillospiraceae bacterium]|nr:hypothetical protein [Oscillospiraceae bacterium]
MRDFPEPYRLADETMRGLNRRALRRVEAVEAKIRSGKFDELNLMTELDVLYETLDRDNRRALKKLYRERYEEIWIYLKGKPPEEDELDEMVELALTSLLGEVNPLTGYRYETEAIRKRDRAKEAILSSPTKAQKQIQMEKALRYWSAQTGFYVDIIADEAATRAMKDAGVQKVRWMIYGDDRVCGQCEALNGTVWEIEKLPEKPHLRCRCWLKPA